MAVKDAKEVLKSREWFVKRNYRDDGRLYACRVEKPSTKQQFVLEGSEYDSGVTFDGRSIARAKDNGWYLLWYQPETHGFWVFDPEYVAVANELQQKAGVALRAFLRREAHPETPDPSQQVGLSNWD